MLTPSYIIPPLPPVDVDFDAPVLLKALALAHRHLAELKGCAKSIPNQGILVSTLTLQEAKASSEIESYVTTQDELFQADLQLAAGISIAAKEVSRYREALMLGYEQMREQQGLLTNGLLISLFQMLKNSAEEFRQTPGTVLKNDKTGKTVFVPPQDAAEILQHMHALEHFINTAEDGLDDLLKMAVIHHQFESIHPFSDGNGRIGRIVSVLYLSKTGLLEAPVLYLSRFINQHKTDYYRLLQAVRDQGDWQAWLLFMLQAVAETAQTTVVLVEGMRELMAETKQRLRQELPKLYSQDLLNNLFRHPYTRIEFVQRDLGITRQTAAKYLKQLAAKGIVQEFAQGKHMYFINTPLVRLLTEGER
ncbi:Fic family protein [Methylophilus sp. 5]|uniref:Fic family protein n=1 Tax=Methylophilus sp. 5 TaxID=1112274 RepID=UPI00048DDCB0|nr:Fic family protein [Methylophilus sp. 5]